MLKQIALIVLACFFLLSCDWLDTSPKEIDATNILGSAASFTYDELPAHVKALARDGYTYASSGEKSQQIPKEQGFYLQLVIDNYKLANASTPDTVLSRLLDPSNYRMLYGKYRNAPMLLDEDGHTVKKMLKHEGQVIVYIARNGGIDTTYYGPMPVRPKVAMMGCSQLDSSRRPTVYVRPIKPE